MLLGLLLVLIIMYVIFDINYVLRTFFTVLTSRLCDRKLSLQDDSSIYGICMFLDCDIWFRNIRIARLVRDLDFARYLYYYETGIYQQSRRLKIRSLQGCTLTLCEQSISLFELYKIITKLVYWDDRSLFFEHKVITLKDGAVRYFFISRQYAIGENGDSTQALLEGLSGYEKKMDCPENIKYWLQSMAISSRKLRDLKLQ